MAAFRNPRKWRSSCRRRSARFELTRFESREVPAVLSFQQGVDNGFGVYTGAVERRVDGLAGTGVDGSTIQTVFVDSSTTATNTINTGSADQQDLLRFGNIFGNNPGQIPLGSIINSATLNVITSGASSADTPGPFGVARMLVPWDQSSTFASLNLTTGPYTPGVISRLSGAFLSGTFQHSLNEPTSAVVTELVQDWANGATNNGFNIRAANTDNGWSIITIGNNTVNLRPSLVVDFTPPDATINISRFQQGVNSYTGTVDALLRSSDVTTDGSTLQESFLDGSPIDEMLVTFNNLLGSSTGQIPSGAIIQKAWLVITGGETSADAKSPGPYSIAQMRVPWDLTSTFTGFNGDGPTSADGEIGVFSSAVTGLLPTMRAGFDVTSILNNWTSGESNLGFNIQATGTGDGWQVSFTGSMKTDARQELIVYWTPGISVPAGSLDITGGALDFNASTGVNDVKVSLTAGVYTITDVQPITLTTNALAAGWSGSGSTSVTGPDASVSSIKIRLTDSADNFTLSSVNDPITVSAGGDTGDKATIPNSVTLTGKLSLSGFDTIGFGTGITLAADTLELRTNSDLGTALTPLSTKANFIILQSNSGAIHVTEADGAGFTVTAAKEIELVNKLGPLTIAGASSGSSTFVLRSTDSVTIADTIIVAGTVFIEANTDGVGTDGFNVAQKGSITTSDVSTDAMRVNVNTSIGGTGNAVVSGLKVTGAGTLTINVNAGSILSSKFGEIQSGNNVEPPVANLFLLTSGANSSIGTSTDRLLVSAGIITAEAGTGGIFLNEQGPQPSIIAKATAKGSGDVFIFSTSADDNGIWIRGPVNTDSGNITLRADDDMKIQPGASIGGPTFSGKILLDANLDGVNGNFLGQDASTPIETSNKSADAVVINVSSTSTGAVGGTVLGNIKVGDGGGIKVDAAFNRGVGSDSVRAGVIRMVDSSVQLDAGPTGTITLHARDNFIGESTVPIKAIAGRVIASVNFGDPAATNKTEGDIFITTLGAASFSAITTDDGTLIGDINLATIAGNLTLDGDVKASTGTITLTTPGNIIQTAGIVQTTGALNLSYVGTATFTTIGNSAPSLSVLGGNTLIVDGSFTPTTAVTVDGVLKGKGSVGAVTVNATGEIAPGTSPGIITTGNLTLTTGSKVTIELNGTTAGTGYDQINVNGTVDLGNATLVASAGFTPPSGSKYVVVNNDGSDSITSTFNGLAEGAKVTLGTTDFTITYKGGDGNDVVLVAPGTAGPPPTVTAPVAINGGAQRSMVQSITITFSEPVSLSPGAFKVEGTALGPIGDVGLVVMQTGNTVTLTFNATGVAIDPAGSLRDGKYKLTMFADKISGVGGSLDGNTNGASNGSPTDDVSFNFHRLFGDADGNGSVNAADFAQFRSFFGLSGASIFDFNGDNNTNASDFAQFRGRFGLGGYLP